MQESMRRTAGPKVPAHSKGIEVHVEQHVRDKMQGWCNAAKSEVSGLFCVRLLSSGIFHVYDVFLPEQQGSSGFTKIDGHATGRLYGYLQRKYGLGAMGDLKGWWHTHYTFGTFWSGTDDDTAQSNAILAEDWSLSIVINQAGSWLSRVDIVSPVAVMIDELPIKFVANTTKHAKRNYEKDIKRWVSPFPERKVVIIPKSTWTNNVVGEKTKYINYGGVLISEETFKSVVDCGCGDMSCKSCVDSISELKRSVQADTEQDEVLDLIANGRVDV